MMLTYLRPEEVYRVQILLSQCVQVGHDEVELVRVQIAGGTLHAMQGQRQP